MNVESMQYENDISSSMTVVKNRHTKTLRECVKDSLGSYLRQMGDHKVSHLYQMVIAEVESPLIETVMDFAGGNQTKAATALGISRSTLRKKLAQYDLD